MSQLNLFGVPDVQETTCQVPCGEYSIWDALEAGEVTQAECWVYQVRNRHGNWQTGISHAKSYAEIAKYAGMDRTAVIGYTNSLVEKGWLEKNVRNKSEKHSQNTANTFLLVHHQCEPHEIPLDKDGCPLKCAVPKGQGSVYQQVEDGVIHWKGALYWLRSKVKSDWTSGIVGMTIAEAKKLLRMTTRTICAIRKRLKQVGLMEQISKPFRAFVCQLFPKPYETRRKRRRENPKGLPCDKDFWYSFNRKWRVSREHGQIQRLVEGTSRWRSANEHECEQANPKIYKDFKVYIDLVLSPYYQKNLAYLREKLA